MRTILAIIAITPMTYWAFSYVLNPSTEKISEAGELIAQAAVPWWIPVIQFFAPLGVIGAIVILALLYFVAVNQT